MSDNRAYSAKGLVLTYEVDCVALGNCPRHCGSRTAEGGLTSDGTQHELRLTAENRVHRDKSAGAPFNVYLRNLNDVSDNGFQAATDAVKARDASNPQCPLSRFAGSKSWIEVYALNKFYRSFAGAPGLPHAQIHRVRKEG